MQVLVFNAGSSSLKFGVFGVGTETREVFRGSYERFRAGGCEYRFRHGEADERGAAEFDSPGEALKGVPAALKRFGLDAIDAVGHRIVHGGARFSSPTLLDDETIEAIANAVGYGDAAFFTRLFRRRVALTPAQYRRRFGAMRRSLGAA